MAISFGSARLSALLGEWRRGDGAGYRRLSDSLRLLIIDGRIPVGARLPSERELAAALDASRTTIAAALDDLRSQGFLETRRGSGSVAVVPGARIDQPGPLGPGLDFATASSAAAPGMQAAVERAVARLPAALAGTGYDYVGVPALREAVAERFSARGVPTRASQILITSGGQAAIALVARTLANRGDRAVVETPGYPHAYEALRLAGARLVPTPVDADHGHDVDGLDELLRRSAPALAYLIPDFHNPTGRSLSLDGRERIVGAAHDSGATLVIDETTAELDIDRSGSFPPVAALGTPSTVTIGSASKVFWGGLRIGWIRASESTIARLAAARPSTDLGTAILDQLVAAELMGDIDAALEHRRSEHGEARDAVRSAIAARLPSWHVPEIDGGVAAWVRFDAPVSSQLAIAARSRGLRIAAGPWFGLDGAFERFLRIPFGPGPAAITQAVEVLADLWTGVAATPEAAETPLAAVV